MNSPGNPASAIRAGATIPATSKAALKNVPHSAEAIGRWRANANGAIAVGAATTMVRWVNPSTIRSARKAAIGGSGASRADNAAAAISAPINARRRPILATSGPARTPNAKPGRLTAESSQPAKAPVAS